MNSGKSLIDYHFVDFDCNSGICNLMLLRGLDLYIWNKYTWMSKGNIFDERAEKIM